jgi:hypothetical protein
MTQPLVRQKSRDHRTRKNASAAEQFKAARHATNAAKGKQIWVGKSIKEGGHWLRISMEII